MSNFQELSYQRHADEFEKRKNDPGEQEHLQTWFDTTTADFWGHERMYEAVRHLVKLGPSKWLTVGDGRFGLDSVRISKLGVTEALPTDISEALLLEGKQRGLFKDYSVENAEKLSFEDDSFDFVFCKEALHHFPRPFIALYEMLRVARKGVVLAEPSDPMLSPVRVAIFKLKKLFGKAQYFDENRYEESGNYIYALTVRDYERLCLGINLPQVVYKKISDFHVKGLEYEKATLSSKKFLQKRAGILINDLLSRFGLSEPNILMICILKESLPPEICKDLKKHGWKITHLPRNPYDTATELSD